MKSGMYNPGTFGPTSIERSYSFEVLAPSANRLYGYFSVLVEQCTMAEVSECVYFAQRGPFLLRD